MKTNVKILIAVLLIVIVVAGGYFLTKKDNNVVPVDEAEKTVVNVDMKSFSGQVTRVFEGNNTVNYSFDIPETATTTISMNDALIKVTDGDNVYASVYFSYEGGRGYTPLDYINEIITPRVTVINPTGTTTIGSYDWSTVESDASEWYIAPVANGQWLMVVESKKVNHDSLVKTLESVKAE